MLTLILGRAGSGKTSFVMQKFRDMEESGMTKLFLIIPEQFSHDAERQLCAICGDGLSLHGEVLSFSRLCSRVLSETGGASGKVLDSGGRLLIMCRALEEVSPALRIYGKRELRAEFLEKMLESVRELKSACVSPEDLIRASELTAGPLSDKLRDMSLILEAYSAGMGDGVYDPDDTLTLLAEAVGKSSLRTAGHIFIDGFSDFTAQEMRVVEALLRTGADITVCLTCDGLGGDEELFTLPRRTAEHLLRAADESGVKSRLLTMPEAGGKKAPELEFLEENLFSHTDEQYPEKCGAIELFRGNTAAEECEYAAAKTMELVRGGCRYRDIAVAACDWEAYGALTADIFDKYGLPVFASTKADVSRKPPVALISAALDVITGGWEYTDIFRYLKTGLTGISLSECDELENYVLKWAVRGSMWTREEGWTLSPAGYETDRDGNGKQILEHLNAIRKSVSDPLKALASGMRSGETCGEKLRALYAFMERIGLPGRLEEKAEEFARRGEIRMRDEYIQLWDIIGSAMEQFDAIMGDKAADVQEFRRLWSLLISQYGVGVIPVSLDRVGIGDIERQRRRDVQYLIVLGATDGALPKISRGSGVFSDGERDRLPGLGISMPGTSEDRIRREMNVIYSSLTQPQKMLFVTYPASQSDGSEARPSFVVRKLKSIFSIRETEISLENIRSSARKPCFELALAAKSKPSDPFLAAALAYFSGEREYAEKLTAAAPSFGTFRGGLSPEKAEKLYGRRIAMSASRVDRYYSCKYAYFLQYGLRASPRRPAGFDAPEAGTFIHFILENVTRDIRASGGFADITEDSCKKLVRLYVDQYVSEMLSDFKDKTGRFRYLFRRLAKDAEQIVLEMAKELKNSDFEPLDFELTFARDGDLPPAVLDDGETQLTVSGAVDRVDGWVKKGRLYLRVVDYKTGKKSFSLSDILYGRNMQMLIYLYVLQAKGAGRYGMEIVPAGVLYTPAREVTVKAPRNASDAEIEKLRADKLRRSGLLLDDASVIEAMGHGEGKKYLPVRFTKDGASGDSLASLEQLGRLAGHIDKMLARLAEEMEAGRIDADPYYAGKDDNACLYCDYGMACHFSEADGDRRRYARKFEAGEAWKIIGEEADT